MIIIHGMNTNTLSRLVGHSLHDRLRIMPAVEKAKRIARPRALTPHYFITVAHGEDLGQAMRQAVRDMVHFLAHEQGMEPYAAYTLLSLAGDVRVSRTFRLISPVKMLLARQVLEQLATVRQ